MGIKNKNKNKNNKHFVTRASAHVGPGSVMPLLVNGKNGITERLNLHVNQQPAKMENRKVDIVSNWNHK